jgi:ubiquinone/menaquinone biosynthesis C-methylase UbiE
MPQPQQNPVDYFSRVQANPGWRNILESFARFVAPTQNTRLLDIGSGPGALVHIFKQQYHTQTLGLDYDFAMLRQAAQANNLPGTVLVNGALPHLPFRANTFDYITATNVLYLVDNPGASLSDIVRLLQPGGTFAMLNPSEKMTVEAATRLADERQLTGFTRENFIHWAEIASSHPRWTVVEIEQLFTAANLHQLQTRYRIGDGLALYACATKQAD